MACGSPTPSTSRAQRGKGPKRKLWQVRFGFVAGRWSSEKVPESAGLWVSSVKLSDLGGRLPTQIKGASRISSEGKPLGPGVGARSSTGAEACSLVGVEGAGRPPGPGLRNSSGLEGMASTLGGSTSTSNSSPVVFVGCAEAELARSQAGSAAVLGHCTRKAKPSTLKMHPWHGQHTVNIRSTHGQHTVNIRSTYGQHNGQHLMKPL